MFQPEVKARYIERCCSPKAGWAVLVHVDPSEMGQTGTWSGDAVRRRDQMREAGAKAVSNMEALGAAVNDSRSPWFAAVGRRDLCDLGKRDIVAVHPAARRLMVVEVEGLSSGQPEQKLYKAIGQIVTAVGACQPDGFETAYVIAVQGGNMRAHLERASVLSKLGVYGMILAPDATADEWVFGPNGGGKPPSTDLDPHACQELTDPRIGGGGKSITAPAPGDGRQSMSGGPIP